MTALELEDDCWHDMYPLGYVFYLHLFWQWHDCKTIILSSVCWESFYVNNSVFISKRVQGFVMANSTGLCLLFTIFAVINASHNDIIKWKHFPRYWPFVWRNSPVNSPHKGQWGGALMFSLICAWISKRLSKRPRVWWFEMPSRPIWRHCNVIFAVIDASFKPPPGLLQGKLHWPGDYEQCLAISTNYSNQGENRQLNGGYCRVSVAPIPVSHDDVIKWKHFPRYWSFVRGIHRSPVNSPLKGQWRGALMFSLVCVWRNGWVNTRKAGDLRRYRDHYGVTVMFYSYIYLFICSFNHMLFTCLLFIFERVLQFFLSSFLLLCHDLEMSSVLLILCEGNPLVTVGISSLMASNVGLLYFLWCFLWCQPEQAIHQTFDLPVISDALLLMWLLHWWRLYKMVTNLHTFSNALRDSLWVPFWFKFHWSLSPVALFINMDYL